MYECKPLAIGRAYRMGQTAAVQVHRLVVQGTVEDRIQVMLERRNQPAAAGAAAAGAAAAAAVDLLAGWCKLKPVLQAPGFSA